MSGSRRAWPQSTAEGRWSTLGPYYAMFPVAFVREAVERWCPPGGAVLDPFCGRGTVPFAARVTGRPSFGSDVNAVAYVFSQTKADPEPEPTRIAERIRDVANAATPADSEAENEFQDLAWAPGVRGFLRAARRILDWRESRTDRTLMALLLTHLHGKTGNAVSNQMRQSKSMAPGYAVRWWRQRGLLPPALDPVRYFLARATWRYRFGIPEGAPAEICLGDARTFLSRQPRRFSLLLTSPPYCGVTHYRVDNWIRLWMLGEGALPAYGTAERYGNREAYTAMLRAVFTAAKRALAEDAAVLVRTDSRPFTRDTTASLLAELWPGHRCSIEAGSPARSQTSLFGDIAAKPGETDFLLLPRDFAAFP